jgi:hypothetical protein
MSTATTFKLTLTQDEYTQAVAKFTANGLSLTSGTLPTEHGVSLSYVVDGLVVTITVLSKPFFVSVAMIESGVKSILGIS